MVGGCWSGSGESGVDVEEAIEALIPLPAGSCLIPHSILMRKGTLARSLSTPVNRANFFSCNAD